jgi:hypothetical protein
MVPGLWWTKSSVMDWRDSSLSQWFLQPEPPQPEPRRRRLRPGLRVWVSDCCSRRLSQWLLQPEPPPPGRNRCASASSLHQLCFVRCLAQVSSLHHVWLEFARWKQVYSVYNEQTFKLFGLHKIYTSLHSLHWVYTEFALSLHPNPVFFWGNPRVGKCANSV